MTRTAIAVSVTVTVLAGLTCGVTPLAANQSDSQAGAAQTHHTQDRAGTPMTPASGHKHGPPVAAITFADLQRTAEQLTAARNATAKYEDARTAEAAGYRAIGPHVPGMGMHYVRQGSPQQPFSITEPPILLYERDATRPGGLRLVGVSYLFVGPSDADGQPANAPFPKAMANWHKHNNICVLPDNSTSVDLTESQCTGRGGRFTAETSWMVHAWIWKDSPAGVFSSTNPLVK
jgi:hypothetical protein